MTTIDPPLNTYIQKFKKKPTNKSIPTTKKVEQVPTFNHGPSIQDEAYVKDVALESKLANVVKASARDGTSKIIHEPVLVAQNEDGVELVLKKLFLSLFFQSFSTEVTVMKSSRRRPLPRGKSLKKKIPKRVLVLMKL